MKKINFLKKCFVGLALGIIILSQQVGITKAEEITFFRKAPDFTLSDVHGKIFNLAELKGKVVLVDFWATWCPFCRQSIPDLKSLYSDYKDEGLEIIGVALEYDGGKALRKFVEEKNITYTVVVGNEKLAKEYSAYGVPTRFLINRQGEIVEKFIGYQDKDVLEAAIKKLL